MKHLIVFVSLCLIVIPVAAHHSIPAKFDTTKPVTLRGSVTSIDWKNPHAHVLMNVRDSYRSELNTMPTMACV